MSIRLVQHWAIGILLGTIAIWLTSSLFVPSIKCYDWDGDLNVHVLRPSNFHFCREGYATTTMGKHGFAGCDIDEYPARNKIIIWGDSQVQGLCVSDDDKIANIATNLDDQHKYLPFAKGGDDIVDWYSNMPMAESVFNAQFHFIVLANIDDVMPNERDFKVAPKFQIIEKIANEKKQPSQNHAKKIFEDFKLEFGYAAILNLLYEPRTTNRKKLRFGIGPVSSKSTESKTKILIDEDLVAGWNTLFQDMNARVKSPIAIIYCPPVPTIESGIIGNEDSSEGHFVLLSKAANENNIKVIDMRGEFIEQAHNGNFTRGFHNGKVGRGHLNGLGNKLIAEAIFEFINERSID